MAAEERATKAERSAARWKAACGKARGTLSLALVDNESMNAALRAYDMTLRSLARHHLGKGAGEREVTKLCSMWMDEAQKRERKQVRASLEEMNAEFKALGLLPMDEEDEEDEEDE